MHFDYIGMGVALLASFSASADVSPQGSGANRASVGHGS